jgi:3-deoxy-D-manno-octulosonic-acid transferase
MFVVYNVIISIINIFSPIISLFVPKLKERNFNLKTSLNSLQKLSKDKKTIWFHSASMGEFEQAKPLIELVKKNKTNIQIICTFFSPSGYNTQKDYKYADAICYLPFDTYWKAKSFINKVNPIVVIFVRYELWYNYLSILKNNNVNTFLINATYPNVLIKTKILLSFYKSIFNLITEIYAVSPTNFELFNALKIKTTIHKSADTRNDRIIEKVNEAKMYPVISKNLFLDDNLILVCGSVWNEDIDIIFDAVSNLSISKLRKLQLILVPHEPTEAHISYIQNKFSNNILLSQLTDKKSYQQWVTTHCNKVQPPFVNIFSLEHKAIIVDSIGKLLKIYAIADLAYIGGSFGVGVHSITEPAGYGIPLVTGANCYNSPDALPLIQHGALTKINNANQLKEWLIYMNDNEHRTKAGTAAKQYIQINTGTTQIIYNRINI